MKLHFTAALFICLLVVDFHVYAKNTPSHLAALAVHSSQSRDTWRSIRTNNLFVVGNASEEDLRQVALWLEFFHSTFGQMVSRRVFDYSVPTTVMVFKDDDSFVPFKPVYQGRAANVAGYFQPGQDTNYIAFSLRQGSRGTLKIVFHEYVHMHLRDTLPGVPLWLNEGLAEFYGSFAHSNNEALLGVPIPFYTHLLNREELLPLSTLFSIDMDSPHYNEQQKSGIFYAESWALVHYLLLGDGGRRQSQFKNFLNRVSSGEETAKVVESVFGLTVEALEKEFRAYVARGEFPTQRVNVGMGPQAYMAMQRALLSDGEANFYLGDLLLHIQRESEAETYFKRAISDDPGFTPTYASLGWLRVRQKRYAEAKKYFERAAGSSKSHLIHYLYAFVLSREGMTDGHVENYSPETARIMREELRKAIKLAPAFADAYYLMAFVNLVTNEQLDEAMSLARQAQKLNPSKPAYPFLLAQIHLRRQETEPARELLERLIRQSADAEVRAGAQSLLDSLTTADDGSNQRESEKINTSATLVLDDPAVPSSTTIAVEPLPESAIRDGQTIERSASMPSLDEVLNRYVQASGGARALSSPTSRVIKGTVNVVGVSRGGTLEIYTKTPNKSLTIMTAQPFGLVKLGFNGRVGWAQTVQGTRLTKGPELTALQRDSDFYNPLTLKSVYPKIKLLGTSKIGYREVYVLELEPAAHSAEKLYLDATTYLPVRVNAVRTIGGGQREVAVEVYLDDWREVDGIKLPFSLTHSFPGMTLGITINEAKHNVPLNDSLFERPK